MTLATRSIRRPGALVAAAAATLAVVGAQVLAAPSAPAHAVTQLGETWTFTFTGSSQPFHVPEDVDVLTVVATGAAGNHAEREGHAIGTPGNGGMVVAQVSVDPGSWLTVWVGGTPQDSQRGDGRGWGFGCGGAAGTAPDANGGAGGGGTAVTLGDITTSGCIDDQHADEYQPLVVAGGGGGAGSSEEGAGGAGGQVPTDGQPKLAGGCGGCNSIPSGSTPSDGSGHHAGGGGGGGYAGGGAGHSDSDGGGGGGLSWVTDASPYLYWRDGVNAGSGSVTLIAGASRSFNCIEDTETITVPQGAIIARIYAVGGGGGSHTNEGGSPTGPMWTGGLGGAGGLVEADIPVVPGEQLEVGVGCAGEHYGGWGGAGAHGGDRGHAEFGPAISGMGGGGASVVSRNGELLVVAGGGGGAGGHGGSQLIGPPSGNGGYGGHPPRKGHIGDDIFNDGDGRIEGGCGGCMPGMAGGKGAGANWASENGGSGGGGGGYRGGHGGHSRSAGIFAGAGGGGGSSYVHPSVLGTPVYGIAPGPTAENPEPTHGFVFITWVPEGPATISTYGGDKQSAPDGTAFPEQLSALVLDSVGLPEPGVEVTFDVGSVSADHPHATFPDGGTTATATTDGNGVATSPVLTANDVPGIWYASASSPAVPGVVTTFRLTNEERPSKTTAAIDPGTGTPLSTFTLQATVIPDSAAGGSVSFSGAGDEVYHADIDADGNAQYVRTASPTERTTWIPAGNHTLTAHYPGSSLLSPSTGSVGFVVTVIPTTVAVASSLNPAPPGEDVTFTATVTVPDGLPLPEGSTLTFTVDGEPVGTGTVGADGTVTSPVVTGLAEGEHTVAAVLAGDEYFDEGIGYLTQAVKAEGTAVTASASPAHAAYAQTVTYTATVSATGPGTPVGEVAFSTGDTALCSAAVTDGVASCESDAALLPGNHQVVAAYTSSSPEFADSNGHTALTVAAIPTTVAVTAEPSSGSAFDSFAVTATVGWSGFDPGDDEGSVQFVVDGEPYGDPVPVVGGSAAAAPLTGLAVGTHSIVAHYLGTDALAAGSAQTSVDVLPLTTETTLVSSDDPSDPGEAVTFTATVLAGERPAAGAVQFRVDGVDLGHPVALDDSGTATSPAVDSLGSGDHAIVAVYRPADATFTPSRAAFTQKVRISTVVTLLTLPHHATPQDRLAVTAQVLPPTFDPAVTEGTVTFSVDGVLVDACTALPLDATGSAECLLDPLPVGLYEIVASYSGGADYTASSSAVEEVINPIDHGPLPVTGAQSVPLVVACGILLLGGGALLLLLTRRRRAVRTAGR